MPNGTCHGCAQALHEFISLDGQKRLEARVKAMAPWPIGKGQTGAIRHRNVEPEAQCNGVIWFYNEDPTPPGGEAYMGWFSNPIVNKAVQTFGGAPPPKPRPIEQALFHNLDAGGEILQSWDVTQHVRQLVKDNSCHTLTTELPLRDALVQRGALSAAPIFVADPAGISEGTPPNVKPEPAQEAQATRGAEPDSAPEAESESAPEDARAKAGPELATVGEPVLPEPAQEAESAHEAEPQPYPAAKPGADPAAEPEPEPDPEPEPEPEPAAAVRDPVVAPVGARLTVIVDGVPHDFDGLAPKLCVRTAMKC